MDNLITITDDFKEEYFIERFKNYYSEIININEYENFCKVDDIIYRRNIIINKWIHVCTSSTWKSYLEEIIRNEQYFTKSLHQVENIFRKYFDDIIRYKKDKKGNFWVLVCKCDEPKQCYSYVTEGIYCNFHQSFIPIKREKIAVPEKETIYQTEGYQISQRSQEKNSFILPVGINATKGIDKKINTIGNTSKDEKDHKGIYIEFYDYENCRYRQNNENEWENVCQFVDNKNIQCINCSVINNCCSFHNINKQNNIDIVYYEDKVKHIPENFKRVNENIFRYSLAKVDWAPVCKNHTKKCNNYQGKNSIFCNFCRKDFQNDENLNEDNNEEDNKIYFYDQIKGNLTTFYRLNGQLFREKISNKIDIENTNDKEYGLVCKFIYDKTKKQCINFARYEEYCNKHFKDIQDKSTTEDGDKTEKYIFDLLNESNEFSKITINGRENSELDIIFIIKGEAEERGIQIKLLYESKTKKFDLTIDNNYNQNTVIVGISRDRLYSCVFLRSEIPTKTKIVLNFNNPSDEIKNNIYDDKQLFIKSLIEYCKKASLYKGSSISDSNLKEKKSFERIEEICLKANIPFRFETTSDSHTDLIINNYNIQCKYREISENDYFEFTIQKIKNNQKVPYSIEDNLDFFIFETKDNDFFVIPVYILNYFGYLTSNIHKGKNIICLHNSVSKSNHWTKHFINNFNLIFKHKTIEISSIIDMTEPINKFIHECYINNIISTRDMNNLNTKLCLIKDKTIKISKTTSNRLHLKKVPYNINDEKIPDFFAFYLVDICFYIIPKKVLIDQKIIGNNEIVGRTEINLTKEIKKIFENYINNFDILK